MDMNGELTNILSEASEVYKTDAEDEEIRSKVKIKYRIGLRKAVEEFADELKKKY